MTPSEHLQAAKEAVAKKKDYRDWKHVITGATQWEEKEFLEEAALLALTNQAEGLMENKSFDCSQVKRNYAALVNKVQTLEQYTGKTLDKIIEESF